MIQRLVKLWQKQTELSGRHFFLCFFHTSHLTGEGCSVGIGEIRVGIDVMWLPSVALPARIWSTSLNLFTITGPSSGYLHTDWVLCQVLRILT